MNAFRKIAAVLALLIGLTPTAEAQIIQGQPFPNFKNLLDNGAMNVAQRGTTAVSSITTTAKYLWDRWAAVSGTSTSVTLTNITTALPTGTGFTNVAQVARASAQTGVVNVCFVQEIPTSDITLMAGQQVALSFWAKAGGNFSAASNALVAQVTTGTGTDEGLATWLTGLTGAASAIPTANATATLTTAWQRFAVTGTIAATATEAVVNFCYTPVGTAGTNDWFQIVGIQLEQGNIGTSYEIRPLGVELTKAQRTYWQIADPAATVPLNSSCFVTAANTTVKCGVALPVVMRAVPTTTVSVATSFGVVVTAGTAGTCTTLAATASSNTVNSIGVTCTTGGTIALGSATPLIGAATSGVLSASADF